MSVRWTEEDYITYMRHAVVSPPPPVTPEMTEKKLQRQVRMACKNLGLLHYHTYRSTKSEKGFPDSCIVSPDGGTLFLLELKLETETPTMPQQRWLNALACVTQVVTGVLRPSTLPEWVARLKGFR